MALEEEVEKKQETFVDTDPLGKNPVRPAIGDFGKSDFGKARGNAPLGKGPQANIDYVGERGVDRANEYAKMAGLNEQQRDEELYQVNQSQAMLKTSMKETSWLHAITQLGFDQREAMRRLEEIKQKERQREQKRMQLVVTVAKLVVTFYTLGGYGAALAAAATGLEEGDGEGADEQDITGDYVGEPE